MRRGFSIVGACSVLALVAGCGSSSSSGGSTGSAGTSTVATVGTATTPTATTGGLKHIGALNYAVPAASAPVQSGVVQVAYRDITIQPDTLKVKVGSTIRWTNYDAVEHDVTSKGGPQKFASKTFGEGGTYEVKLTKPGVVHYECTIHPASMNGTIVVVH